MRLVVATALVSALVLAAPALASGEREHAAGPAEHAKKAEHKPGTSVELPFLIAPIVVEGRLVGYAYISSKIIATSPAAAVGIRERTPFLQDAFIRDVNAAPIGKKDDPKTVDQPALVARLLADSKRIAGSARVSSLVILQIQTAGTAPNRS